MNDKTFPELRAHVDPIVRETLVQISARAGQTKSAMPYKCQFILEQVIKELQARV